MTSKKKAKKRTIFFAALALLLIVVSILAPWLCPNDPNATNALYMKAAPCRQFPFGTDSLGRCVCSRVLMGARTSVFSALLLVAITFLIGTVLGMLCGFYGGALDTIVMRLADTMLAFPQMVLAIAVAGILGGGMGNAMAALGITGWTLYARLARSQVLAMKKEPYILAARLGGCSDAKILFRHLLPNILSPLLVNATTQIGVTMMGFAGLSFLGLGVQLPNAEWGSMINEARGYMQLAPWAVLAPGAAMVLTVMIFNYLGDSVQELMDVKAKEL
ncbi:MAG: ABC transporter permease [Lachnospiraceae bacterium]|nr:ABC transporter permease [Lachnospiraceae bacterium]